MLVFRITSGFPGNINSGNTVQLRLIGLADLHWIYWVADLCGAILAVAVRRLYTFVFGGIHVASVEEIQSMVQMAQHEPHPHGIMDSRPSFDRVDVSSVGAVASNATGAIALGNA